MRAPAAPQMRGEDMDWDINRRRSRSLGHICDIVDGPSPRQRKRSYSLAAYRNLTHANGESESNSGTRKSVSHKFSDSSDRTEEKKRLKHEKKLELEKQHEKAKLERKKRRRRKWSPDESKRRAGGLIRNITNAWYSLFNSQTYIVVNEHGTTFRFSESKSLFLFPRSSKFRQYCINLFIRPLFSHFIMLVILANCICMMLAEPPKWIDSHLEYVFTAIYCFEALIKIIGRGFVLHRFSYLRDPWNWLDFIVIVFAIITEVLKVAMYSSDGDANDELSQLSVLRAFRVLRALKTMSVVPGLRGIVKALLRSIRALQDAVALTIFCVSVFALVGYQLFHGTLRNKCVLIPGYIDVGPDAIYLVNLAFGVAFMNQSFSFQDFVGPSIAWRPPFPDSFVAQNTFTPLYNTPCTEISFQFRPGRASVPQWTSGMDIMSSDTNFTQRIFDKVNERLANLSSVSQDPDTRNCSNFLEECVGFVQFDTSVFDNSSLLFTSTPNLHQKGTEEFKSFWGCEIPRGDGIIPSESLFTTAEPPAENTTYLSSSSSRRCNVTVEALAGNIACLYKKLDIKRNMVNSSQDIANHRCYNNNTWVKMMHFGEESVERWQARKSMTFFQLRPSYPPDDQNKSVPYGRTVLIIEEYTRSDMEAMGKDIEKAWDCDEDNYIMRNVDGGMYFYVNSSNRPGQEPLYCKLGDETVCPSTHKCVTAGGNPDYGYTNFDQFFWAFLTSFRLINQDAWSRLYYLTLHTIGESYVIFYIFVMFLGSYYLINLILAVVYMAYEEQQAAAEDEALEEEEHKAERREIQPSSDDDRGSRSKDGDDNGSRSSVKSCCIAEEGRSFGLITTSLTSIADSSGMRRSYRSSRRYRYGHRRPQAKVDPESEMLYRKYTRRYGDGMSRERIDNFSFEADQDRYRRLRRRREDSVASTGSFRTMSERNSCSKCSSKDINTSYVGYCPQCRSHRKHSTRKSRPAPNNARKMHELENEKVVASAEPQFKLVVTSEAPNDSDGSLAYPFLAPGQTPKPVGALLKNSTLDVFAVDFAPGRSPSIYSTASEGNYEVENESDDTSKHHAHTGNEALLNFPRAKQISECRPNINRCGLLAVPFDRTSQSTVSMSSNSEAIDGGEQIVQVDVRAPNAQTSPSHSDSIKFIEESNTRPHHPASPHNLNSIGLKVPPSQVTENGTAMLRQVPSLMVTSASSEHIVSLCKREMEADKEESNKNGVGLHAEHNLPAISLSPSLNSTDHNLNELRAPYNDIHDRMSDSGISPRSNRSMYNRHRHKQFHRGSSLDLMDNNSYPPDRSLKASVIDNLHQSRLIDGGVSPTNKFRFFDKEPESIEMLLINGHVDRGAISEIAANMLSAEEDPNSNKRGKSLKSIKRQLRAAKETTVNIFWKWTCCTPQWERLQMRVRLFALDPFMDLFITLCIFLNTFFMMMEYHPAEDSHKRLLEDANLVFTTIFTLEMFFKVIGLGPYTYFREAWNLFDAVVVISSLLEIILQKIPGLSVLRAFRLMRILKLAKSWPTLNKLLRIIGKTLGKLWHLTLVFLLVLFIFAVVGMQLLRENYKKAFETHMPRWNFVDFPHAFMVVFRIQCGEWIENMFTCMNVAPTGICITLFILVLVIGNLVILNLFLALLLNSFSGDALQRTDAERNSLAVAWRRILGGIRRGTRGITGCLRGCNVIADCCSKLQLQLCLKHRRVQSSDKKTKKRKKTKSELEPSKTETTMLRDSETELNNFEERRNNNHTEVILDSKLSSGQVKALGIVSNDSRNVAKDEEFLVDKNLRNIDNKQLNVRDVNCTFRCLGCDKEFNAPKPKAHSHRKRTRIREGFAPAAAFQNRPDEACEGTGMANQSIDDVTFRSRRRFLDYESVDSNKNNSSDDRSKVASTESNTSGSVRQSNSRKLRTCSSEKSHRSKSATRKRGDERTIGKSSDAKYLEADENDSLMTTENNVEFNPVPSRQSSRIIGRRSRLRSNASTSTRRSSSSTRLHQSMSRSRSGSPGSCQEEEVTEANDNKKDEIPQCFPPCWTHEVDGKWWQVRTFFYNVAVHRYFENVVIFCILLSSVALAFEDIHLEKNPPLKKVLEVLDKFFCTFFTIEMLIKWTGFGLRYYFTNAWCLLDFIIVFFSLLDLCLSLTGGAASEQLGALRVLRTFRALRPLRALSRFQGMKVVVDALVRAIPSIFHVFLVCVIVWLIFSILGVNLFGGKFGRCVMFDGQTGYILPRRDNLTNPGSDVNITESCVPNATFPLNKTDLPAVRNRAECETCAKLMNTTEIQWMVPSVNFDNVGQGFLALMQVATFKGWLEIMACAVDITGEEEQPAYEYSFQHYVYFCVFIVFGAFFSLNLFIGVIIDNFNQQKVKCAGGEDGVFLTDEQKRYYNAMKRMAAKAPSKPIPRPSSWFSNKIYDVVTDRKFEMGVMIMILLNMVVMAIEHYDMSPQLDKVLENLNLVFICVFVVEAVLKLIGLRWYYFTVIWNIFDFIVVVVSVIATALSEMIEKYFVQPTLFRIIRLFRVTRILRLIREAKGIRTLLFALMMSLPALFNIGSLLFLVVFIYAILGMSQFAYIQKIAGLDDILNFETFPNTFLVLFQVSTSEGWNTFIEPILRDKEPLCDPTIDNPTGNGNCGNAAVGVGYFVTFVLITFLIVINMYIAIILENFEVATRESAEPLTADDFEQFFEVWQRYDDKLTQYVTIEQLQHFLHHLDFPLRVPFPNRAFIVNARMKITKSGRVHCLEVIIALIKKVLGDSPELEVFRDSMIELFEKKCHPKGHVLEEETMDTVEYERRRRAAIVIQKAYKAFKNSPVEDSTSSDYESSDSSSEPT